MTTKTRDTIDEIKRRLPIVELIQKKGGADIHESGGIYIGHHKAHDSNSKTSLHVDQKANLYHCFNCGEGGDIFDYLGHLQFNSQYKNSDTQMFYEVLKEAAAMAGVQLPESKEDSEAIAERRGLEDIFALAADYYHEQLPQEQRDWLHTRYGLTDETIDKLKIGFAPASGDALIKHLILGCKVDRDDLLKTGLVIQFDDGSIQDVFQGRLMFPYWWHGKLVYFIGRITDESPRWEHEAGGMKYKKQMVHGDKHPYVSKQVRNDYFYGEDDIRGADEIFLTEGVTDCIIANQAGFPCVSPVTVRFREADIPKIVSLCKAVKTVYIVNDNEANEAGKKGARATAEALWNAGITAKFIELPRPEGIDKVDLNDFLREQGADALKALLPNGVTLLDVALMHVNNPPERKQALSRIFDLLAAIDDEIQHIEWKNKLPELMKIGKTDYKKLLTAAQERIAAAKTQAAAKAQAAASPSEFSAGTPAKPSKADLWFLPDDITIRIEDTDPAVRTRESDLQVIVALLQSPLMTGDIIKGVFVHYPIGQLGDYAKQGDTYLSALIAEARAIRGPQKPATWPYGIEHGCIVQYEEIEDPETGEISISTSPLCNFNAWIVADVASDDGEESKRKIAIAGELATGTKLSEITINADDFEDMQWPVAQWGARVSIEPGRGVKDTLRHAIQVLSQDKMTDRRAYTHTGWTSIDGKRVFLHAGGAIGAGNVNVDLPKNLCNYRFPDDNAIDEVFAMRESIKLLDVAPVRVSAPLWGAMYQGPLSEIILPAFTVDAEGGSGSLKSSYTGVLLNHYGPEFSEYAMPADWLATANSLEKLCFHAKDVPLVIDDLRPTTSLVEGRMLQDAVARITRAAGNRQGRSRLDSNSEFKRTYPPRGVVMMTAERKAMGKSVNARILTVDIEPGDVDSLKLAAAQKQRHIYSYAMRGYIRHVAENWDELSKELPAQVADLRAQNSGNGHHRRLPNATAVMYTAFNCAMSYAMHIGAITEAEAQQRMTDCYLALQDIEETQNQATEAEDPALKYVTIIATLIAQDKAHLDAKGDGPNGRPNTIVGMALSEKLGWHEGRNVYLLPGCYNTVCKYASAEGWQFPSDENTLRKELERGGWITKTDPNRLTTKQRQPGGATVNVIAIAYDKLADILRTMGVDL